MHYNEFQRIVLKELIKRHYNESEKWIDWMGYPLTDENKPTYHHIEKSENLRKNDKSDIATIENGAVLGKKSHEVLHKIELYDGDLYEAWNYLFLLINRMGIYPIYDVLKIMQELKIKTEAVLIKENEKN